MSENEIKPQLEGNSGKGKRSYKIGRFTFYERSEEEHKRWNELMEEILQLDPGDPKWPWNKRKQQV